MKSRNGSPLGGRSVTRHTQRNMGWVIPVETDTGTMLGLAVEQWPNREERLTFQSRLSEQLADALDAIQAGPAAPQCTPATIRDALSSFDFDSPISLHDATARVVDLLKDGTVHMMHPGYFGLFNPSVTFPGLIADQITSTINPQLAVWSHAPAAVEIERHTIEAVAGRFGWPEGDIAGHFTSGGAEANYTAVLVALTKAFPDFADGGARSLAGQPRLYVSAESHLAWLKIAHQAGIGRNSVCLIGTDGMGRMDVAQLKTAIDADRKSGQLPFFVGATAGTTNAGMIDPLEDCSSIAKENELWFHVDAAWGGAAILSPRTAQHLNGTSEADSITLDAHKWFAVPMGSGMFLCRGNDLLGETFRVAASYMPSITEGGVDPYTHSIQWSRRFIGLRLFLSLAVLGWGGYRAHVDHAVDMADTLKHSLGENGWQVVNDSPLAVICFVNNDADIDPAAVADSVVADGRTWISTTKFENRSVLRACITSHFTGHSDLEALIGSLERTRRKVTGQ